MVPLSIPEKSSELVSMSLRRRFAVDPVSSFYISGDMEFLGRFGIDGFLEDFRAKASVCIEPRYHITVPIQLPDCIRW